MQIQDQPDQSRVSSDPIDGTMWRMLVTGVALGASALSLWL